MDSDASTFLEPAARPGDNLRRIRIRLGLSTRRVADLSRRVAEAQGNGEFSISHARLVQIENEESVPSLYKLFTLSSVYGVPVQALLSAFLNLDAAQRLHIAMGLPNTHVASFDSAVPRTIPFPAHLSSTCRGAGTDVFSHLTQAWGEVPVPLLDHLKVPHASYGFIGLADYTMYPLIRPGSVVQLEYCDKVAKPEMYRTEFDRPIYFLQSRTGYLCSWCEMSGGNLFSIPHPLSPCRPQAFAFPSEIDVIGRVTGVALRLEGRQGKKAANDGPLELACVGECERANAG